MTNKFFSLAAPALGSGDLGRGEGDPVVDQAGINAWSAEIDRRAAEQVSQSLGGDEISVSEHAPIVLGFFDNC